MCRQIARVSKKRNVPMGTRGFLTRFLSANSASNSGLVVPIFSGQPPPRSFYNVTPLPPVACIFNIHLLFDTWSEGGEATSDWSEGGEATSDWSEAGLRHKRPATRRSEDAAATSKAGVRWTATSEAGVVLSSQRRAGSAGRDWENERQREMGIWEC
nr:hypothetical protein Iba_chr05aCG10670 [Ipomoea batatas]